MSGYTLFGGLVFVALTAAAMPVSRCRRAALWACEKLLQFALLVVVLVCGLGQFFPALVPGELASDMESVFDRLDEHLPGFRVAHRLGFDWLVVAGVALVVILPHIRLLQKARRAEVPDEEPDPESDPVAHRYPTPVGRRLLKDLF